MFSKKELEDVDGSRGGCVFDENEIRSLNVCRESAASMVCETGSIR